MNNSVNLPENFKLSAYPNPFNGWVNIQFTILKRDNISITIYNMLGQKIQSLFYEEEFNGGSHHISWDPNSIPSGVYYCVLNNTHSMKSLKLMLVK